MPAKGTLKPCVTVKFSGPRMSGKSHLMRHLLANLPLGFSELVADDHQHTLVLANGSTAAVPPEDRENRPEDGLGRNRVGDAILCYAWGETDRPYVMLAKSTEDVKRFIVTEWIGDEGDPYIKEVMEELATHDWRENGELKHEFEIGGVSFQDVVVESPTDH